jgi:hypothetical protein
MALAEFPVALAPVDLVCKDPFGIAAEPLPIQFNNAFKLGCFTFVVSIEGEPVDEGIAVDNTD